LPRIIFIRSLPTRIVNAIPTIFNFLRTGHYGRSYGDIGVRVTNGDWWSTTAGSATYGHGLDTSPTVVFPQYNGYRGNGFAVRYVVRER